MTLLRLELPCNYGFVRLPPGEHLYYLYLFTGFALVNLYAHC